jgi:hypothetical protein
MKNKVPFSSIASALVFCAGSVGLQAQTTFLDTTNLKPKFETVEVVNSAGEPVSAIQASAATFETDANGVITSKELKEVVVEVAPTVVGGESTLEKIVTQVTKTATPDPVTGVFEVLVIEQEKTTPVDSEGTETGATTTETVFDIITDVEEEELELAPATSFEEVDPELEIPVVISAE